jgi:hypothetical protein
VRNLLGLRYAKILLWLACGVVLAQIPDTLLRLLLS